MRLEPERTSKQELAQSKEQQRKKERKERKRKKKKRKRKRKEREKGLEDFSSKEMVMKAHSVVVVVLLALCAAAVEAQNNFWGEQQGEKYKAPRILYIVGGLLWTLVFLGCYMHLHSVG